MPFFAYLWLFLFAVTLKAEPAPADPPHADLIRKWDQDSFVRGQRLYESICMTCHGTPEREGTLPTARPFWKEPFKNGSDPLSLYKTLSQGLGQMPAWTFLTPEQRYDAIHYIREAYVRTNNPAAYFKISEEYLTGLPQGGPVEKTVEMIAFEKGPPYKRMEFGPALFWTLQVETNNIAYKGIAVRVDEGPGGVSKGHAWILYDQDTMRVAAAWTGDEFIDWRGIAFDGSHGTHASIMGKKLFVNPPGPGWADPENGQWHDPRLRGRDDKPYGPLPREWAHYEGIYYHRNKVVIAYTIGGTRILEQPGYENGVFVRTLNISALERELTMRVAPDSVKVAVNSPATLVRTNGFSYLRIPPSPLSSKIRVVIGSDTIPGTEIADLSPVTQGGPSRWNPPLATRGKLLSENGPFAVEELVPPPDADNPWHTWMRFGGFDFFKDGKRAAICTWNGDVWTVSGVDGDLTQLTWKRIASGLFQPLGVKIVDETIYVTCRDQIARLHDFNGDEEIDYVENFNNDHQVTEHFHEFAMGLQTDAEGNFYYAKSARHALPAVVPQHGTLLKVSKDGSRTEIVANGFRAANGVCINDDGTFFVTDQEGHWTPKNRINWVHRGGFYGNMFGYHDRTGSADSDMEQPLVWITNEMDRSPGELVRITSANWGALSGSLLSLSYGTGRVFLVPYEKMGSQLQGGVVQLPIPDFPTGVMRGRFHPGNGHLYACGMYAWAGNRQVDGGFYRIRATGKPFNLPLSLHAHTNALTIEFSDELERTSAENVSNYHIKTWSLKRSANYGSKHYDTKELSVTRATLEGKTVRLTVPEIVPTWSMEIRYDVRGRSGEPISQTIHNTIHVLAP
jgi:mono/diheme cytochrome c family protein